jgi:translation initiation factor 3 subunit G
VSELAEEQELRDLFERFGRVTRVFLARDRETQRAKGFAFISFADRSDAARACDKMDGCMFQNSFSSPSPPFLSFHHLSSTPQNGLSDTVLILYLVGYRHLILRVEFAKRAT